MVLKEVVSATDCMIVQIEGHIACRDQNRLSIAAGIPGNVVFQVVCSRNTDDNSVGWNFCNVIARMGFGQSLTEEASSV